MPNAHARYRFHASQELYCKGNYVVVLERLPRGSDGCPRYLVQGEDLDVRAVRQEHLEEA